MIQVLTVQHLHVREDETVFVKDQLRAIYYTKYVITENFINSKHISLRNDHERWLAPFAQQAVIRSERERRKGSTVSRGSDDHCYGHLHVGFVRPDRRANNLQSSSSTAFRFWKVPAFGVQGVSRRRAFVAPSKAPARQLLLG